METILVRLFKKRHHTSVNGKNKKCDPWKMPVERTGCEKVATAPVPAEMMPQKNHKLDLDLEIIRILKDDRFSTGG